MNPLSAPLRAGTLKASSHELKFEDFLKRHELHASQSECGLGWVQRNYSNSGIYQHSVGLDVVNSALRSALPDRMGSRALFRFMIPRDDKPPHLVISGQQLEIPDLRVQLPKNPDLELDIGGLLMMIKAQAKRSYRSLGIEPTPDQITMLMTIWFGWAWLVENSHEPERTVAIPVEMNQWLSGLAPAYLCVVKWVWPKSFESLTLDEAIGAKGIPAQALATLYPKQENES